MSNVSPLNPRPEAAEPPLRSIAQWEVHQYWPKILPHLNKLMAMADLDNSLADIHHFLVTGNMQAWHDPEWKMVAITQIQNFGANPQLPTKRVCLVAFCAGDSVDDWVEDGIRFIHAWGKKVYGTTVTRVLGRPGWERKLPGFKRTAITLEYTGEET